MKGFLFYPWSNPYLQCKISYSKKNNSPELCLIYSIVGEIKNVLTDHLLSSSSSSINWSFFVEVVRDRNAPILA